MTRQEQLVVSASWDGTVRLVRATSLKKILKFPLLCIADVLLCVCVCVCVCVRACTHTCVNAVGSQCPGVCCHFY